jgi:asparagine synthase (glutamine-hydrolysing)
VDGEFLRGFGDYARRAVHISDGTHDAFGAHDVYFCEHARQTALVRLTGKFGSEVVRIRNLVPSMRYPPGFLRPDTAAAVAGLPHFAQVNAGAHPLTRVVTEEIPYHEFGRIAVEQSQVVMRTPYMDNELVKLMYQAPADERGAGNLQELYVKQRAPEFAAIPTNLGRFATGGKIANKVLYAPLWALFKMEYIYLYATPHWMTRMDRALAGLRLERFFAGRQKWEGYRIWMKTDFADFIRQTLLTRQPHYADFFERETVERMVKCHLAGTHNYLEAINRTLTLELACATLLKP